VCGSLKFQSTLSISYFFGFGFYFWNNNVSQSTQHYESCGFGIIPELHSLDKWIWNDSRVTFIPEAVCFLINFEESPTHHGVMLEENCHCWLFTSLLSHQLRYLVSHLWFKQGTGTVTFVSQLGVAFIWREKEASVCGR